MKVCDCGSVTGFVTYAAYAANTIYTVYLDLINSVGPSIEHHFICGQVQ